jgi:hypothetical protein
VPAFLGPATFGGSPPDADVDFNGDGLADRAVVKVTSRATSSTWFGTVYSMTWSLTLEVQLGNGGGSFRTASSTVLVSRTSFSTNPFDPAMRTPPRAQVFVGDFTSDGKLDVLAATSPNLLLPGSPTSVRLHPGRGNGALHPAVNAGSFGFNASVRVDDVNRDGRLDFFASGRVDVYLGDGGGAFRSVRPAAGTTAAGDFDGDGRPDLAVLDAAAGSVSVSLGNGDGTYQPAQTVGAGPGPSALGAVDLDGDGWLDLAVSTADGLTVLFNNRNW